MIHLFYDHPRETELILTHQSDAIKAVYSLDNELRSIENAWDILNSATSH